MKSCLGSILEVDLSLKKIQKVQVPEEVYAAVLSGKGLGVWYCLNNIPAGADTLGPDNVLGFCSGALTGTGELMTGRWFVVGKSPLTGGWGDASCGGMFSPAIKRCGVDAVFFRGASDQPVYLYMDDTTCELRGAAELWGLDAVEAEQRLMSDAGKNAAVAVIGTSGEKLSLISGICNESGRIAARSGLGAVMGSKKLKALVLAGTQPIPCADLRGMHEHSRLLTQKIMRMNLPSFLKSYIFPIGGTIMAKLPVTLPMDGQLLNLLYRRWGTPMFENLCLMDGDAPVKNWAGSRQDMKGALREFDPDRVLKMQQSKYHCYSCPLGCGGTLNTSAIPGMPAETHKPEYETINHTGALLLNNDLLSTIRMSDMLNRAGMDSISAGATLAWAIECFERGILSKEDTDGLELHWGATKAILALLKKMIEREGFGNILADGVKRAAERIGRGSEQYAIHAGGQELPAHDPRNDPVLALNYAAEPAPGKHTVAMGMMYNCMALHRISSWAPKAKTRTKAYDRLPTEYFALCNKANVCYTMLADAAGTCYYGEMMGTKTYRLIDYLNTALGWTLNGDEYLRIGERIQTMRQMFNIKHGIDPKTIRLPKRALGFPPLSSGANKGVSLHNAEEQIRMHWKSFSWDENTGVPTEETIKTLNIDLLLKLGERRIVND